MSFPLPGKVEGISGSKKPVLEMKNAWFKYALAKEYALTQASVRVAMSSRIAIVGPNGAGKSTLLSLLCGEIRPVADPSGAVGEVARHRTLRLAYIAQSHAFHLGEYLDSPALTYMQHRYRPGYDEALQARLISTRSEEEEKVLNRLASRYGKYGNRVEAVVSRKAEKRNEWKYEVKWKNLEDKQNTFESVAKLRQLGVERLASALDERLAAGQVEDQRPKASGSRGTLWSSGTSARTPEAKSPS